MINETDYEVEVMASDDTYFINKNDLIKNGDRVWTGEEDGRFI